MRMRGYRNNALAPRTLTFLAALACGAAAHAQVTYPSLGRLFTSPAERFQLDQQRVAAPAGAAQGSMAGAQPNMTGAAPPGMQPGMPQPGREPGGSPEPPPPPPEPLRLTGVVRRNGPGGGQGTVWVNGEPRETALPGRPDQGVDVDVNGRRVRLKPGQTVDPNDGTVREAY